MNEIQNLYKDFKKCITEKDNVKLQEIAQSLQINQNLSKYFDTYQSIIRTSLISLRFHIPNPNENAIGNAFNAFGDLMKMSSQCNDFEKFMNGLSMLTRKSDLEQTIKLLIVKETRVPVRQWLHLLTDSLRTANANDQTTPPKDDQKETFVQLTSLLLIFVQIECSHSMTNDLNNQNRFNETMEYLDVCMQIKRLDENQYGICFEILKKFIAGLRSSTEFSIVCEQSHRDMSDLVKNRQIRATLIMDTYVTISRIIIISKLVYIPYFSADNLALLFELISVQLPVLQQAAYNKFFCSACCGNVGEHTIIDLATDCYQFVSDAIASKICTGEIVRTFAKIISTALVTASNIKCSLVEICQRNMLTHLRTFLFNTKAKEQIRFQITILQKLLSIVAKVNLSKAQTSNPLNALYLFRYLSEAYETAGDIKEVINTGLLYIPFAIAANEEDSNVLHNIVYRTALQQRLEEWKKQYQTPYDYLRSATVNMYGLQLPENIDYAHILCVYLRLANSYINFPTEFNNKIIHQLLLNASNSCPSKYLTFVLYTSNFCFRPIEQTLRNIINTPSIMNPSKDKLNDYKLGLIKGAFKFVDYMNTVMATDEKYRKIFSNSSLAEEFAKTNTDLNNDLNLTNELDQKQILLYSLEKLKKFIAFYLKLEPAAKEEYKDEIKYISRDMPRLARQFAARLYSTEAMDTFFELYRLTENDDNNEIDTIMACSHFLENPIEYEILMVDTNNGPTLKSILDKCNQKIVNQLKSIEKLSARKQIQVYICMLNIALYYVDQGSVGDGEALLKFIDQKINDDSQALVRLKYDYVTLQMAIKYQMGRETPWNLACKMSNNLVKMINLLGDDGNIAATIIFRTVIDLSSYCYHRHKEMVDLERLSMALAKYSLNSGIILRAIKIINIALLISAAKQKPDYQEKLHILNQLYFNEMASNNPAPVKCTNKLIVPQASTKARNVSPIRKVGKTLSPYKVVVNNVEYTSSRYLVDHPKKCKCPICRNSSIKPLILRTGCLRVFAQLLQSQYANSIEAEFQGLYDQWMKTVVIDNCDDAYFTVYLNIWLSQQLASTANDKKLVKKYLNVAHDYLMSIANYDLAVEQIILILINCLDHQNDMLPPMRLKESADAILPVVQIKTEKSDDNKKDDNTSSNIAQTPRKKKKKNV